MRLIALFVALLLFASPAAAVVVTVGDNSTDTHSGADEVHLKEIDPTTNYDGTVFELGKWDSGDHTHGLIRFTGLSAISGPVTVSTATLYVFQNEDVGGGSYTIEARRLLRNWVEAEANWSVYSAGNSWTTGGGISDGNDRSATVSGSVAVTTSLGYYGITGSQLITDVENMINGSVSNFGWHIERQGTGNDNTTKGFTASEGTDSERPYLDVTYSVSGGGGGGTAAFFRRRIQ